VRGDRGFFALHNAALRPQEIDLEIRLKVDDAAAHLYIQQLYPENENPLPGTAEDRQHFVNGTHLKMTLPPRSVRLFKIGPPECFPEEIACAGIMEQVVDPQEGLYLGNWKVGSTEGGKVRLSARFTAPRAVRRCLDDKAAWLNSKPKKSKDGKTTDVSVTDMAPYLLPLLVNKDKQVYKGQPISLLPPPGLAIEAVLNGKRQPVNYCTFGSRRRTYYALRLDELKREGQNELELILPDQEGLVFRGCYIEVPDEYRE
jgi:hypothetical protein